MSAKLMGQIWDLDLPHNEAWVLMAVADHADHNGDNAFPGVDLLAYKTGYEERNVRRVLSQLEDKKILIVVDGGVGRGKPKNYSIRIDHVEKKKRTKCPVKEAVEADNLPAFTEGKADKMPANGVDKSGHFGTEKRTFEHIKADISDDFSGAYKELTIEPNESCIAPADAGLSKTASRKPDPFFEKFQSAYLQVYGCPYQHKAADFVQLANCRKQGGEWLTIDRWQTAVANYFSSDLGTHTLADLSARFGPFFRSTLDRFGKPKTTTVNGVGNVDTTSANRVAVIQQWAERKLNGQQ